VVVRESARPGAPAHAAALRETLTGQERCQIAVPRATAAAYAPDGRLLAVGTAGGDVHILRLATGRELGRLRGHRGAVRALAFSGDGRRLYSGGADSTVVAWDAAPFAGKGLPEPAELTGAAFDAAWADLARADAGPAFAAMRQLQRGGSAIVPPLRTRLRPAEAPGERRLATLLVDLESDEFATRQQAEEELIRLGELAVAEVRNALDRGPALDTRLRLQRVFERMTSADIPAEQMRAIRAVEVLEQIRGPGARSLLETLAGGAPGAGLTRAAQGALTRLHRGE
jgi:hypothetical protein